MVSGKFSGAVYRLCLSQGASDNRDGIIPPPIRTRNLEFVTATANYKMGREEQIEEREVLDSIFPEEIQG